MQTIEKEYLEIRKQARSDQESIIEQPENTEAVDVSKDAPIEEVITEEAKVDEEVAAEIEEPAETEIAQATDENESEDLYVEYQGREINLKDVYETEQGQLRQADYTRKTQEHAEDVKIFKADVEEFKGKQSKFDSHIATLEAMISEESLNDEALVELREYEPEKYIEYTEKLAKRKKFVSDNKVKPETKVSFNVNDERQKLWSANPLWGAADKPTKAYASDMKLLESYAKDNGYSDFSNFKANDFQTMLNASKYLALNNKNAAIEKKVRLAPVTTKPRAKANNGIQSEIDVVQKRFNKTGSDKDFLQLRRLQRQLK